MLTHREGEVDMTHLKHVSVPAQAKSGGHSLEFIKENLPTSLIELIDLVTLHIKEFFPQD